MEDCFWLWASSSKWTWRKWGGLPSRGPWRWWASNLPTYQLSGWELELYILEKRRLKGNWISDYSYLGKSYRALLSFVLPGVYLFNIWHLAWFPLFFFLAENANFPSHDKKRDFAAVKISCKFLSGVHIPSYFMSFQFLKWIMAVGCPWLSCHLANLQFEVWWSSANTSFLWTINITQSIFHRLRILQ